MVQYSTYSPNVGRGIDYSDKPKIQNSQNHVHGEINELSFSNLNPMQVT